MMGNYWWASQLILERFSRLAFFVSIPVWLVSMDFLGFSEIWKDPIKRQIKAQLTAYQVRNKPGDGHTTGSGGRLKRLFIFFWKSYTCTVIIIFLVLIYRFLRIL